MIFSLNIHVINESSDSQYIQIISVCLILQKGLKNLICTYCVSNKAEHVILILFPLLKYSLHRNIFDQ